MDYVIDVYIETDDGTELVAEFAINAHNMNDAHADARYCLEEVAASLSYKIRPATN